MKAAVRAAIVLLLAGIVPSADRRDTAPALQEETARARVQEIRLRIQPRTAGEFEGCFDFDEGDLKVSLRGDLLDSSNLILERERQPTLHALLLDASGSMRFKLADVRMAAGRYVQQLRPGTESALVATFDDSLVLLQPPTNDLSALMRSIDKFLLNQTNSLYDALYYTIRELDVHRQRSVIVLLTDSKDTSSLNQSYNVAALVNARPNLTVFAITFGGRETPAAFRRNMHLLAETTGGRGFTVQTAEQLSQAFQDIRALLDGELILQIIDPDPTARLATPKIRSRRRECTLSVVESVRATGALRNVRVHSPYPELPHTLRMQPSQRLFDYDLDADDHQADPECAPMEVETGAIIDIELEELWVAHVKRDSFTGCTLDMTMEPGVLYDPRALDTSFMHWNAAFRLKTRWFDIPIVPVEQLPNRPHQVLDQLAAAAIAMAGQQLETDERLEPRIHALPFHGLPQLSSGRTFFDIRARLAHALFLHQDHRVWAESKLIAERDTDLERMRRQLQRAAPDAGEDEIALVVEQSPRALEARRRTEMPTEQDLSRHLSAWLGDITAHDLLVSWEQSKIDDLLERGSSDAATREFVKAWTHVQGILYAPSYARVLTLLYPIHDLELDRIGLWRIVLPRPMWVHKRLRGDTLDELWGEIPLDLLPDSPMAYRALAGELERRPALARRLKQSGYRVDDVEYESLNRPTKQTPRQAFRNTRVTLKLSSASSDSGGDPRVLEVQVDMRFDPGSRRLDLEAVRYLRVDDPALAELTTETAPETDPSNPGS